MDNRSFENLVNLLNQYSDLVKSHAAIKSFTARRMNLVVLILEAKRLSKEVSIYVDDWEKLYPLDVQRETLFQLKNQFDEINATGLLSFCISESFDDCYMDQANNYFNENLPTYNIDKDSKYKAVEEKYSQEIKYHIYCPVWYYNAPIEQSFYRVCREYRMDCTLFESIFDFDRFGAESEDLCVSDTGKKRLHEYREFLFMLNYYDLFYLLKDQLAIIYDRLEDLIQLVDNPSDAMCEGLYAIAKDLTKNYLTRIMKTVRDGESITHEKKSITNTFILKRMRYASK